MQLIDVQLTNTITGQSYGYQVQVNNNVQFYSRLNVLMEQLAMIEDVSPANISHNITAVLLAA